MPLPDIPYNYNARVPQISLDSSSSQETGKPNKHTSSTPPSPSSQALGTSPAKQQQSWWQKFKNSSGTGNDKSEERKRKGDDFAKSLLATGQASVWLQDYDKLVAAKNPNSVPAKWPDASRAALKTLAARHRIDYQAASHATEVLQAYRNREIEATRQQQQQQQQEPPPPPIDIGALQNIYATVRGQTGNNANALVSAALMYKDRFPQADEPQIQHELAKIARATAKLPGNRVPLQQTPASIDLGALQDIYSTVRMEIGNDADALVAATLLYQDHFPQADERQIQHELAKIAAGTTQQTPAPLDTGTVIDVYTELLQVAGNDADAAYCMAALALKEIYEDADESQIERALASIGAQPPAAPVNPTPPVATASVQFTGELEALQEIYEQHLEDPSHDRLTAAAQARKMFMEWHPDIEARVVDEAMHELIAMHKESGGSKRTPSTVDISAQTPSRGENIPLTPADIIQLQSIFRSKFFVYGNAEEARARTLEAFFDMYPQAQMKQVEAELRKLMNLQEQGPVPTSPPRKKAPEQGSIVTFDLNKAHCGTASPEPVAPNKLFYRETKGFTDANGARASLNALVGWNCFSDDYVAQVKRDLVKSTGRSMDVNGGRLDPEVLAECLRRKARDEEIDSRWSNAQAQTVVVNDALWEHLKFQKEKPAIIGHLDSGTFVTHRVDAAGQSRILDSGAFTEMNRTIRHYLESTPVSTRSTPAPGDGLRRIHLITY